VYRGLSKDQRTRLKPQSCPPLLTSGQSQIQID